MKKGFTLIELLAVIVILAIIAVIATPIILNVIEDTKAKAYDIESSNIEKAAEYYLTDKLRIENIPEYTEYYIKVSDLSSYLNPITDDIKDNYVVVKKSGNSISYYYTGRDNNPYTYSDNKTLKEIIEDNIGSNIANNVVVNGTTVNKVIGTKAEKKTIKNWVYYSGQLWQVLETTDNYVKLIATNSVTSIAYGETSEWSTSWLRKWLNEIDSESSEDGVYYHNLSRVDLLLDGRFCLDEPTNVVEEAFTISTETRDKVTSFTPISTCSSVSSDKIGLMTFEDYVYALNGTDGITGALGGSFIDEDEIEWTMTKYTVGGVTNKTWHTYYLEPSHIEHNWRGTTDYGKGVRPVIYLSNDLLVEDNNAENYGEISNPYKLVGEQTSKDNDLLNTVTIGSYVYISEENNPNTTTMETVTDNISYTYDKTKVRYRVIGINADGSIKLQRADILRNLSTSIAINSNTYIPFYYYNNGENSTSCMYVSSTNTYYTGGCVNNNYFKPTDGSGAYAYTESENIGYFLNNTINGYYTWLSDDVKANLVNYNWNLNVSSSGTDYTKSLFNIDTSGIYPSRISDGIVSAYVGLPSWGDMFAANDINITYWLINRWLDSSSLVSKISNYGYANSNYAPYVFYGARPVIILTSDTHITTGEGTSNNPYILSF
ncbi:MAG: prepilin-type N-terminal cleavage/methylation domain-containing protein [Bacilli bacterium]|nr:prepilin-type N-terminal cleavage/methylation domain-containing protein [Bacilli bacterium]